MEMAFACIFLDKIPSQGCKISSIFVGAGRFGSELAGQVPRTGRVLGPEKTFLRSCLLSCAEARVSVLETKMQNVSC